VKILEISQKIAIGITLIALIITIIIMLILAGVTIAIIMNGGLFTQAQDAVIATRASTIEERRNIWFAELDIVDEAGGANPENLQQILEQLEKDKLLDAQDIETIKQHPNNEITISNSSRSWTISFKREIGGGTPGVGLQPITAMQVGDYVKYDHGKESFEVPTDLSGWTSVQTFDKELYTGGWRVMYNDSEGIEIISAGNVATGIADSARANNFTLRGRDGYNNMVDALNQIPLERYFGATYVGPSGPAGYHMYVASLWTARSDAITRPSSSSFRSSSGNPSKV
jgi:hypothetical protein